MFGRHGIPEIVISDNGPQFKCMAYSKFAKEYGFTAIYTNPLYPQSNGQAKRYVQTIKKLIKEINANKNKHQHCITKLSKYTIRKYQRIPHLVIDEQMPKV